MFTFKHGNITDVDSKRKVLCCLDKTWKKVLYWLACFYFHNSFQKVHAM